MLPLIVTAIILAVQNLKAMTAGGSKLAKWTIVYYVLTTCLAVVHSMILVRKPKGGSHPLACLRHLLTFCR